MARQKAKAAAKGEVAEKAIAKGKSHAPDKESESTFWADNVAEEMLKKKRREYVCEGMWSPSGYMHLGNARAELFTPNAVYLALKEKGAKVRQNFILDDFDPIDKIPAGIPVTKEREHEFLGKPYYLAPSPVKGSKSWADYFVSEVREALPNFGLGEINIISAYETYKRGKFNELIKFSLDNAKAIVLVWNKVAGADKPETFVPVQVICEKCGILVPATSWDGKEVSYSCSCWNKSKISPLNGKAKLHWRVHWVAHWALHDVAFESGGKDHFSKGGSVDVGRALCREVFKTNPPLQFPTEFLLLGGRKMAGSVGNVFTLSEWLTVAQPEMFRYLNFSYRPQKAVDFSLHDNSFILLNERYERAERIYYGKEKAENEKIAKQLKRAYINSRIGTPGKKMPVQVPYSFAAFLSQLMDPEKDLGKITEILAQTGHLGKNPSAEELRALKQKLISAKTWVENYAPDEFKVSFAKAVPKEALEPARELRPVIESLLSLLPKAKTADEIQQIVFESAKQNNAQPRDLFKLLYLTLLAKERGPRIGTLIIALGKERVTARLKELL
ncbi:MAG: lysine--tRNA ligase [Candidatus Diapherotrites archaeon]